MEELKTYLSARFGSTYTKIGKTYLKFTLQLIQMKLLYLVNSLKEVWHQYFLAHKKSLCSWPNIDGTGKKTTID